MGRPIIGITGELEAARWGNWIREAVVSPVSYTRAVERAGGTPVILPPVPATSVPVLIAGISGLLLTGGRDVDPSLYDEAPHEQTDIPDHRRDRFELILTRAAIDADLPILAIGRGMHILNVARGGTLTQHLPDRLDGTPIGDPANIVLSEDKKIAYVINHHGAVNNAEFLQHGGRGSVSVMEVEKMINRRFDDSNRAVEESFDSGYFGQTTVLHQGPQFVDRLQTLRIPQGTTIDLSFGVRKKKWELYANIVNIFDHKLYTKGVTERLIGPKFRRNFDVTMSRKF